MAIPLCAACGADLGPEVTDHCPQVRQVSVGRASDAVAGQGVSPESAARGIRRRPGGGGGGDRPHAAGAAGRREAIPSARRGTPGRRTRQLEYLSRGCWASPTSSTSWTSTRARNIRKRCICWPSRRPPVIRRRGTRRLFARPRAGRRRAAGRTPTGPACRSRWTPDASLRRWRRRSASISTPTRKLSLWENRTLGLLSRPGETEADFRTRCRAAAEEQAKQAVEMEKVKFRPKFESLDASLPDEKPRRRRRGRTMTRSGRRNGDKLRRTTSRRSRKLRRNGSASARRRRPSR